MTLSEKYTLLNDLIKIYKKNFSNEKGSVSKHQKILAVQIRNISMDVQNKFEDREYFLSSLCATLIPSPQGQHPD